LIVDGEQDITSVKKRGLASNVFEVDAFSDPAEELSNFKTRTQVSPQLDHRSIFNSQAT
jgi:DNA-binding response OmpR family regulator